MALGDRQRPQHATKLLLSNTKTFGTLRKDFTEIDIGYLLDVCILIRTRGSRTFLDHAVSAHHNACSCLDCRSRYYHRTLLKCPIWQSCTALCSPKHLLFAFEVFLWSSSLSRRLLPVDADGRRRTCGESFLVAFNLVRCPQGGKRKPTR